MAPASSVPASDHSSFSLLWSFQRQAPPSHQTMSFTNPCFCGCCLCSLVLKRNCEMSTQQQRPSPPHSPMWCRHSVLKHVSKPWDEAILRSMRVSRSSLWTLRQSQLKNRTSWVHLLALCRLLAALQPLTQGRGHADLITSTSCQNCYVSIMQQ